jgi:hypothetical protein
LTAGIKEQLAAVRSFTVINEEPVPRLPTLATGMRATVFYDSARERQPLGSHLAPSFE